MEHLLEKINIAASINRDYYIDNVKMQGKQQHWIQNHIGINPLGLHEIMFTNIIENLTSEE